MRCILYLILFVLGAGPAVAEERLTYGWRVVLTGCLDYVRTGQRAVFDGWDVAWPGGGVCNGDPVCEKPTMTFIPSGRGAMAAITVHAPERVGDAPERVSCRSAIGVRHTPEVFLTLQGDLAQWEMAGVLWRQPDDKYGQTIFHGCGYDGRLFSVSLAPEGFLTRDFYVRFPVEDEGADRRRCGLTS